MAQMRTFVNVCRTNKDVFSALAELWRKGESVQVLHKEFIRLTKIELTFSPVAKAVNEVFGERNKKEILARRDEQGNQLSGKQIERLARQSLYRELARDIWCPGCNRTMKPSRKNKLLCVCCAHRAEYDAASTNKPLESRHAQRFDQSVFVGNSGCIFTGRVRGGGQCTPVN